MSIGFLNYLKWIPELLLIMITRWYRRAFYYVPTDNFSLQIGNFGTFFDKGLFTDTFVPQMLLKI